ncbi:hypothetical protein [Nannocystis sp. SCPEA4]|uniref:hypothetical protein n=1 Tax=Nannocystis sp. SCPEA4 TaxID=2996787 RepID=UPI00226DA09A|nr:hypothetical protein [Nannocystis sp. SCPEA4]MCY1059751.1 hypothetical protein [Nannocystis sp. SCPEA4]
MHPRAEPAVLAEFYRRVRPPGFWGRTAAALGEDPRASRRELARGLGRVVREGLVLYLALYGSVRLLFPLPGSGRLGAVVALAIAGGLVLWARRRGD